VRGPAGLAMVEWSWHKAGSQRVRSSNPKTSRQPSTPELPKQQFLDSVCLNEEKICRGYLKRLKTIPCALQEL